MPQDDEPGAQPHEHQVRTWDREGDDRVGRCACLTECARMVKYYLIVEENESDE